MKRIILPFLLCSMVLLGAGCKKSGSGSPAASSSEVFGADVFLPPPAAEETENQRNLRELREAIDAFRAVKTFRAKLSVDGKEGVTTGQIDIMKPDRFHGTMRIAKESQTSEVIGVSDTLYVRLPDGSWAFINTPAIAKALTEAFRSAIDGNSSVIQAALPDDSNVAKQKDSGKSCERYRTQITSTDGAKVDLDICIHSGLPKFMEIRSPQGNATIEYFDYNKPFVIERPTVRR